MILVPGALSPGFPQQNQCPAVAESAVVGFSHEIKGQGEQEAFILSKSCFTHCAALSDRWLIISVRCQVCMPSPC